VELINKGGATLVISGTTSTNPNFSFVVPPDLSLGPHESRGILLRHVPPLEATEPERAELEVWSGEEIVAALHASSLPTSPDCSVPPTLDFGPLALGETGTLELPLRNSTSRASGAFLELYTTHEAFETSPGWKPLESGESSAVAVTFTPRSERNYTASLFVKQHPLCQTQPVRLLGAGAGLVLTFEPEVMNWVLPVGRTEVQAVTLRNVRFAPIELSDVRASLAFDVIRFPLRVPPAQRSATGLVVPGEATVEIAFTAQTADPRAGQLVINTDVVAQPTIQVNRRGFTSP
jgi:hypothetical protein